MRRCALSLLGGISFDKLLIDALYRPPAHAVCAVLMDAEVVVSISQS